MRSRNSQGFRTQQGGRQGQYDSENGQNFSRHQNQYDGDYRDRDSRGRFVSESYSQNDRGGWADNDNRGWNADYENRDSRGRFAPTPPMNQGQQGFDSNYGYGNNQYGSDFGEGRSQYGSGYSGQSHKSNYGSDQDRSRSQNFDPDYYQWRQEQMENLDRDYQAWRSDRYKKFSDEFNNWRTNRPKNADTEEKMSVNKSGNDK